MGGPRKDDDLFEWTVAETDFAATQPAAEPEPPVVAPSPAPPSIELHISRRVWLTIGGTVLAVLLALGLNVLWQRGQLALALRQAVAREDAAILSGDSEALKSLIDPQAAALQFDIAQRAQMGWQYFPIANLLSFPLPEAGAVRNVMPLSNDLAQVEVARPFTDDYTSPSADQQRFTYAQTQFYRKLDGEWKRTEPPESFWGEYETYTGQRLTWKHLAIEASLVRQLGPALDSFVMRACELWVCPADLRVELLTIKDDNVQMSLAGFSGAFSTGSNILDIMQAAQNERWSDTVNVMALPLTGTPTDMRSQQQTERALKLRILVSIVNQLQSEADPSFRLNEIGKALLAYAGEQLGIETERPLRLLSPDPRFEPAELWEPTRRTTAPGELLTRDALVLLNRVLRAEPPDARVRLIRSLPGATDHVSWLAEALSITTEEAEARWRAAMQPLAIELPIEKTPAYAMYCDRTGVQVWSPGEPAPQALLPEWVAPGYPRRWSPDGQRLLISVGNDRFAIADFPPRTLIWIPAALNWPEPVWVSTTLLAYPASPVTDFGMFDPSQSRLYFFDVTKPGFEFGNIGGIHSYNLSPDGSRALIVSPDGEIGVMPALGGEIRWLAQGFDPQWMPDGQAILFRARESEGTVIKLVRARGGEPLRVFSADQLPADVRANTPTSVEVQFAISPDGWQIALSLFDYSSPSTPRVGLMPVTGGEVRVLPLTIEPMRWMSIAGFSRDGRRLAVVQQRGRAATTLIYDADRAVLLRSLPGYMPGGWLGSAWSGDEHDLRLVSEAGEAYRLRAAGDGNAPPEKLEAPCGWAVPNPVLARD